MKTSKGRLPPRSLRMVTAGKAQGNPGNRSGWSRQLPIPPGLVTRPPKPGAAVLPHHATDHSLTSAVSPSEPALALPWEPSLCLGQVSVNIARFRLHLDDLGGKVGSYNQDP